MPGLRTTYNHSGRKKRLRRTPYHYLGVRLCDHYNIRKLADKMNTSMAEAVHRVVADRLRLLNVDPLTLDGPPVSGE